MNKNHSDKLRDPRWIAKRDSIFARDNNQCRYCQAGHNQAHLQVRHLVFGRFSDPWNYPDDHYVTICTSCHNNRSQIVDKMVDGLRLELGRLSNAELVEKGQRAMAIQRGCVK